MSRNRVDGEFPDFARAGFFAEQQIFAGLYRLGHDVSGLVDSFVQRGFKYGEVFRNGNMYREETSETARSVIDNTLSLIEHAQLPVDQDFIRAGARAVSKTSQEAAIRATIVGVAALQGRYGR